MWKYLAIENPFSLRCPRFATGILQSFLIIISFSFTAVLSVPEEYSTIQEGIDAVSDGDTVLVAVGIYYENINFNGKNIAVIGENRETTIIDGGQNGSVVIIDNNATLMDFSIINGYAEEGGGIFSYYTSSYLYNLNIQNNIATKGGGISHHGSLLFISNCKIIENTADNGGGIFCDSGSSQSIESTLIEGNTSILGGGLYLDNSNTELSSVNFASNQVSDQGGAIYCYNTEINIASSLFYNNISNFWGGGAMLLESELYIQNSTFVNNIANYAGTLGITMDSNIEMINSIFWGGSPQEVILSTYMDTITFSFCNVFGGEGGITNWDNGGINWMDGNIDFDPQFKDPDNGDFTLQPTSPCIDAGNPESPLDPDGTIADMGAYYFHQEIGCTDEDACNFNPDATIYDGNCLFNDCNGDCGGDAFENECGCVGGNTGHEEDYCYGCTDLDAINYEEDNTIDDGSCAYSSTIELTEGYNLIGFNLLPISFDIVPECVITIIGEGIAASRMEDGSWVGSLADVGLLQTDGYWFYATESCTIEYIGNEYVEPDDYRLHSGKNLISYPCLEEIGISNAILSSLQPYVQNVIGISGEGLVVAAANLSDCDEDGCNWIGSLQSFLPNHGYWFEISVDTPLEDDYWFYFSWDCSDSILRRVISDITPPPDAYQVSQSIYQAFYFVEHATLYGEPLKQGDLLLAYNGDVLVGSRYWMGTYTDIPAMGYFDEYTAGYCEIGDIPSFRVLKESGEMYTLTGDIPEWENNEIFMISLTGTTVEIPTEFVLKPAYPNPFNPRTTVKYGLAADNNITISVFDVSGKQVAELYSGYQSEGDHSITWDGTHHSSGIYFIKLVSGEYQQAQKVVLLK